MAGGRPPDARFASLGRVLRGLLLLGAVLVVLFALSESLSGLILFHLEGHERHVLATVPAGELVWYDARVLLTGESRRHYSSEPSPLFVGHPTWGYTIAPGDYAIRIHDEMTAHDHVFRARVLPDGSRATRHDAVPDDPRPKIYLFGDSWMWGWGNQDEHTVGWLLQGWLPRSNVRNLAQNGYGNVQALVQIREMASALRPEDTVVLAYGDFFDPRNVAAPSRLREFHIARELEEDETRLTHPRAALVGGRIQIDSVELAGDHAGQDPDARQMQEVTVGILREVVERVPGPVVLAYLQGADTSPVLSRAAEMSIHVADLRPRPGQNEWDDFQPFDVHPGPLADYHFAEKLYRALQPLVEQR